MTINFIVILILLSVLIASLIYMFIKNREHDKYIKSINVGDVFADRKHINPGYYGNPFHNDHKNINEKYDDYFYVIITDIRKNGNGDIWVRYIYDNEKHYSNPRLFTERIENFLIDMIRIDENTKEI